MGDKKLLVEHVLRWNLSLITRKLIPVVYSSKVGLLLF